ncbi:MFS transporter, partial [Streptomyces sp. NPDC000188]
VAALRTGTATGPAALNDGYALGLAVTAGLFVLAAVVAIGVLPRRRAAMPGPQPTAPTENRPEGTPS